MKIISTIVDSNYIMYGLELEGRSSEFKEEGKDIIRKVITLNQLINKRFKNNQIECKKSGIKELNNFKLNKLPMKLFDGEKYIKIKNELFLIKRLLVKGKLEGFLVDIGGIQKRFSTQEIINLSTWYYPINFYIRSRNNKVFISGRKGLSIKKLPAEELSTCSKINKKETLNTAFNKKDISNIVFFTLLVYNKVGGVKNEHGIIIRKSKTNR